jgi:predicted RNA-binding Zn-ribbon protein involved in translation (DUF1610 family)
MEQNKRTAEVDIRVGAEGIGYDCPECGERLLIEGERHDKCPRCGNVWTFRATVARPGPAGRSERVREYYRATGG